MTSELIDLTPSATGIETDLHQEFAAARKAGPLVPAVLLGLPGWVATGQEVARDLFTDPRLSSNPRLAAPHLKEIAPWAFAQITAGFAPSMLSSDPPDHNRLRRLVSSAFTTRRVEALRPRTQEICDELLARMLPHGHADLIEDFAVELPLRVIMELLGVPVEDRHSFREWSVVAVSDPEDPARTLAALASIHGYLDDLISRKSAEAARGTAGGEHEQDLLTALIAARDEGGRLNAAELLSMTFLLLLAGHETTTNLIGNGTLMLLRDPVLLRTLRDDPSLTGASIEEFIRLDSPVAVAALRFATEEIRMGDAVVAPGEVVFIATGATGRDPDVYLDPDVPDVHREPARHLGFGHGIHFCIGAALARMEADIAFRGLLSACDDLALGVPEEDLRWRRSPHIRGLRNLPVVFSPRP
ncbi:cytochrome P450 family protein [Streptomyces jumonjinensis]|uniref:Cytochrome P450 n=1 Tax=Streptomyces jumonjinensis TaxID=1945 RepID=A0A646KL13_STRJU|nr:cytochrome P450 [Streptomyces jumonjinensis]MQT02992.1 cytochrome P450 [Streptomyces jumonjinensis]